MGSFQKGKYDTLALPGKDIHLTLDANLQAYAEQLMQNKKGGIVAIEMLFVVYKLQYLIIRNSFNIKNRMLNYRVP